MLPPHVEWLSSFLLKSNSFISHSFEEFVELSLSPDLCSFDLSVDEWFALSRVFFFVEVFSTERTVDCSVFVSSACSPLPEEFVLTIESLRLLNSPDGIRIVR